jgi:ABC-type lipoprotein export system ATPase subunit
MPEPTDDTALDVDGVSKRYVAGVAQCRVEVRALTRVSAQVRRGEILVVTGPAGAGKSTLLYCAAGLLRPDDGRIRWFGGDTPPSGLRALFSRSRSRSCVRALRELSRAAPDLLLVDGVIEHLDPCAMASVADAFLDAARAGSCVIVGTARDDALRGIAHAVLHLKAGVGTREPGCQGGSNLPLTRVAEPQPEVATHSVASLFGRL